MSHYLTTPPAGGARWDDPGSVTVVLCGTLEPPAGTEHPRGPFTHDPAAVTCRRCRHHPKFPAPPPVVRRLECVGGCGRGGEGRRPPRRRRPPRAGGGGGGGAGGGRHAMFSAQCKERKIREAAGVECDGCCRLFDAAKLETITEGKIRLHFCADCRQLEALEAADG